jgi:S1-C subfamily serine protease
MPSPRPIWKPLVGTALLAFVLGACARQNSTVLCLRPRLREVAGVVEVAQVPGAPIRNADDLRRLSGTFADIARKVTPAVVNIQSETVYPGRVLRDPFYELSAMATAAA